MSGYSDITQLKLTDATLHDLVLLTKYCDVSGEVVIERAVRLARDIQDATKKGDRLVVVNPQDGVVFECKIG